MDKTLLPEDRGTRKHVKRIMMKDIIFNNPPMDKDSHFYHLITEEKDPYFVYVLISDIDKAYGEKSYGDEFYRMMHDCPYHIHNTIFINTSFTNKGYVAFPCKNEEEAKKTASYMGIYTKVKNNKVLPLSELGRSNGLNTRHSVKETLLFCLSALMMVALFWYIVYGKQRLILRL